MNIENGMSPEEFDEDGLTPEQREYATRMLTKPENIVEPVVENERRDCEAEVAQLENLFDEFESKHSVSDLMTITRLTRLEAENNRRREPARLALNPMYELIRVLKEETNISPSRHDRLKARYLRLSKAVGSVTKDNIVRH